MQGNNLRVNSALPKNYGINIWNEAHNKYGASTLTRPFLKHQTTKRNIMKNTSTTIRALCSIIAFGAFASIASAGPGPQHWESLGKQSQFKELKPGMSIGFVCNTCKSVSVVPIKSEAQAMAMCKDGGSVTCPSCKQVSKVVVKRARNDAPTHTEVSYVNSKGQDCAFMVAMPKKM